MVPSDERIPLSLLNNEPEQQSVEVRALLVRQVEESGMDIHQGAQP